MPKRTPSQNKAAHLYFRKKSEAMNKAGVTANDLSGEVCVPFTQDLIEKYLWNKDGKVTKIHRECFRFMQKIFNEIGLDFRMAIPESTSVKMDGEIFKECVWRPVQIKVTGKESSADLTVSEVNEVYEMTEKAVNLRFPAVEPVDFPEREKQEIDYPDEDVDPSNIPF